jgi:hypothetical protein
MKYLKPKSMTWWAGLLSILTGLIAIFQPANTVVGEFAHLMALLTGGSDSAPAVLIFTGMGLIGLRAAPGVNGDAG